MKLRILSDRQLTNLEVIRRILDEAEGRGFVEFRLGSVAANLKWRESEEDVDSIHLAIPMCWMTDLHRAAEVARATHHFLEGVRSAK